MLHLDHLYPAVILSMFSIIFLAVEMIMIHRLDQIATAMAILNVFTICSLLEAGLLDCKVALQFWSGHAFLDFSMVLFKSNGRRKSEYKLQIMIVLSSQEQKFTECSFR